MPTESKPIAGELGVIVKNVVALRAEPDGGTEQVTQALMGQSVVAEGGQGDWLFCQTWDTYRGWIPTHSVRILDAGAPRYASSGPVAVIRELFAEILEQPREGGMIVTKVTLSVELEVSRVLDENWVEVRLPEGRTGFLRSHQARLIDKDVAVTIPLPDPRKLVETAQRFIGTPYYWGGTSPFGIDCSGFMQLVHHVHGVTLLRDAHMQAGDPRAEPVEKQDLRTGDLVFFSSKKGKDPDLNTITHVGMALSDKLFIHSCGHSGVIISPFTDPRYVPTYWGARRMRLDTLDLGGGAPER